MLRSVKRSFLKNFSSSLCSPKQFWSIYTIHCPPIVFEFLTILQVFGRTSAHAVTYWQGQSTQILLCFLLLLLIMHPQSLFSTSDSQSGPSISDSTHEELPLNTVSEPDEFQAKCWKVSHPSLTMHLVLISTIFQVPIRTCPSGLENFQHHSSF